MATLPAKLSQLLASYPRTPRALALLGCIVACGATAGVLIVPPRPGALLPDPNPPPVTLDGKPLPLSRDREATLEAAKDIARAHAAGRIKLILPSGPPRELSREELGAVVDQAHLASLVVQLRDPSSPLRRRHEREHGRKTIELSVPLQRNESRALSQVLQLKDELDRAPVDARYDYLKKQPVPDEPGVRVDAFGTLSALDDAFHKGASEVAVAWVPLAATRQTQAVQGLRFDDVLGYFETKYARDLKHEARTFNLKLAASKLSGYVLFPGETFDFNAVVGPRTEANGYKVATVIAQGELVDGIGGGTCQIAGTLHGAAFFAGLDIVERKPHTRPSFYIKMGMDSTVVYPTITFRFKNPFDFPVALHEKVEGGVVRAEILGPKRTRDVTFVRKVNEVTPFHEKEAPDPKIPKGERVLSQRGIPGFRITRYRIIRDGAFAVREKTVDVYPSVAQIWRVGTGDADPKFEAHDDEHPEYVADEYLMVSQGPSIKKEGVVPPPGGAMVESRVAGKYGSYGWTVREGFSKPFKRDKRARVGEDESPGTD